MVASVRRPGSTDMPETPASRRIVADIRAQIESGKLQPGDRLPTGRELKQRYQVSDTPVKTAIDRLEAMGLVVRRQGVGWFVAD